jgi:hypothetical protein
MFVPCVKGLLNLKQASQFNWHVILADVEVGIKVARRLSFSLLSRLKSKHVAQGARGPDLGTVRVRRAAAADTTQLEAPTRG